jgi:hypothetical protein
MSRKILRLIVFSFLALVTGIVAVTIAKIPIPLEDLTILTICFAAISLISLLIFLRGQPKDPSGKIMHLLVAISVKFLIELVLALIWFFVAKKSDVPSLLLFFILYLGFSLFLVYLMLNTLKHNSL